MKRLSIALLLVCSCTTTSPVGGIVMLDKDAGVQCTRHCGDLGMRMSAVVIISGMHGCVCEPRENKTAQSGGAAAVTSGAVAALAAQRRQQEQQREEKERRWQQQPHQPPPPPSPPPPPH